MYGLLFFFQAEDGIRDLTVTGVQTCALPIFDRPFPAQPQPMPMGDAARREAGERRSLFDWIRKDRAKASEPASEPAAPARAETSERADEDVFPPPPRFERAPQRGGERVESAPRRFAPPEPEEQRGFEHAEPS